MKEIEIELKYILFFAFILFLSVVYIYYGALTDSWGFGDETYYYLASKSIVENNWVISHIPKLYATAGFQGEWLGKPPLSYYMPTIFYWLGNGNLTVFKLFAPIFGILTVLLVFIIGKNLYNFWAGFVAAILTAGTPLFIHFSIITYAETLTAFFILLSLYTAYKAITIRSKKWIILAGIIFGLVIKEISFFIPIIFIVYLGLRFLTRSFDMKEFKILAIISVIGLLLYSPWLIRNYVLFKNPVFPAFPNIFGYGGLDPVGYQLFRSAGYKPLIDIINALSLKAYFYFLFFFGAWGLLYLVIKRRMTDIWLLSIILVLILPIFLVPTARDIRYLFPMIPILALPISFIFIEMYTSASQFAKYYKIASVLIILLVSIFSLYHIVNESKRIDEGIRHMYPGVEEGSNWIKVNVPKDAVIMDLWTPNFVYTTDRVVVFPHAFHAGELWNFWNSSEQNALELLKKHGINYVIVETILFQPEHIRKGMAWISIPEEFIYIVKDWSSFELVYNKPWILIYKINYETNETEGYEIIPIPWRSS